MIGTLSSTHLPEGKGSPGDWALYPWAGRITFPNFTRTEASLLWILPDLALCLFLSGYSFVSFIKTSKHKCLSSVSRSRKLSNLTKVSYKPPTYSQVVRSLGGLRPAAGIWSGVQSCRTESLNYGVSANSE